MGVLQDDSQGAPEVGLFDFIDIDAVIADFAILDVIKAVDQIGDGGFPRTSAAHKSDFLSRRGKELDVVQNDFFIVVTKVHIVKDNIALQLFISDCAVRLMGMPPSPQARSPGRLR